MFLELYAQIVYELFWYFLTKIIIYFLMRTIEKPSFFFLFLFSKICKSLVLIEFNDAEKFTSEMHDPCARSRCLQKRTKQEHLTEGAGVEPAKHPPKVKSEIFYNSRVLERNQSRAYLM